MSIPTPILPIDTRSREPAIRSDRGAGSRIIGGFGDATDTALAKAEAAVARHADRYDARAIRAIAEIAAQAKRNAAGWGRVRLIALRRLGEYLIRNGRPQGRPGKTSAVDVFVSLAELGITDRHLSAEAKSVARIDQQDFDAYLVREDEPTLKGLLRSIAPAALTTAATNLPYRTFHAVDAATTSGEFYTPPEVFHALGDPEFDIDVASPGASVVGWIRARRHLTPRDDGLSVDWAGAFVWAHPVYGVANGIELWIEKFVANQNGIMLVPDFTSAGWWHGLTGRADAVLFVKPKINFLPDHDGHNTLGSTLVAIGERGVKALLTAEHNGRGLRFRR